MLGCAWVGLSADTWRFLGLRRRSGGGACRRAAVVVPPIGRWCWRCLRHAAAVVRPCPARDRRARVLEERLRGGLGRSSKGHSAGCWFVSVQEPGAAAVVGRGGGGALYAPDLPTLGASGREGRSFSLLFGAQPLRGTTLAPACPMRPASRSRHREPSACSRMSHDLLVSHYASSHLSLSLL